MKGFTIFVLFLFIHVLSVWFIQTAYVPDEVWQSLEVAHHLVFQYGKLTWEWTEGVRSFLYPGLMALLYKGLAFYELDTVLMLTIIPRVMQAVFSAYADLKFWKWICQQTGTKGQWAAFSLATSWFWIYCGSRTLSNTFETCLTMMALQAYPWSEKQRQETSVSYLWYVGVACITRPTAAIVWVPLCFYNFITTPRKFVFIGKSVFIMSFVAGVLTAIDIYLYGRYLFTPWNFIKLNVLEGVGSFYGSHPYHWYLSQGLPVILGLHFIPFVLGVWKTIKARWLDVETPLLCVILWTIFIYSLVPHKEHRFILPLLPMALFISSKVLSRWSQTAHGFLLWTSAILLLAGGIAPAYYFGTVHQQGTIKVMPILADAAAKAPNTTSILFLMPCHSTPLYSHVHKNIPMRFLTCEPNLKNDQHYVDEADQFFQNPQQWLDTEFPEEATLPTHVVSYDVLHSQIQPFLKDKGYILKNKLFHMNKLLIQESRIGEYVTIYIKK